MAHITHDNSKIISRIRRLKGQLEGVERMLQEGGDCYKVLQNVAACRGALNSLTRELLDSHIEHHLTQEPTASDAVKEASQEIQQIIRSFLK